MPARCRDALPLPRVTLEELLCDAPAGTNPEIFELWLNTTGAGLNFMFSGGRTAKAPRRSTQLHLKVCRHLYGKLSQGGGPHN